MKGFILARSSGFGCELIEEGEGYDAAETFAMKLANERGVPFLSPYDDVDVVAGNGGTLGLEIVEALGQMPKSVVAPIGGGGLATGLACAFGRERIVLLGHSWGGSKRRPNLRHGWSPRLNG